MQQTFDISIIIVNWRSAAFVVECLKSIRKERHPASYEILVVDNASFDDCERALKESGLEATYIQSDKNLGFSAANNLASTVARGRVLLFLNPDTEVRGLAIQRLHDALLRLPDAGAVGPKLLNRDGSVQSSCIQSFPTILNQALDFELLRGCFPTSSLWGTQAFHAKVSGGAEIEVISGACLMIKREVFEMIGRFSEDYFMYGEDVDLCLKVQKAGLKRYYVPEAIVVHFGGSSSGHAASGFSAMMTREALWRYFRKWHGRTSAAGYRLATLGISLIRLGILGLAWPVQFLRGQQQSVGASIRKWWAVLHWSLRGQPQNQ